MKRSFIVIVFLALATLSGCLVSSLHPFFKQKDKVFEPELVGNWIDGDSCIWTIAANEYTDYFMGPKKSDSTYHITYYEEPNKAGLFIGTLFRLKGVNYVDFYPEPNEEHCVNDFACWHHFPTHTLARIQHHADSIMLYWFAEELLTDLFDENRIRIKHETIELPEMTRHILTASTNELQKFIKKYLTSSEASMDVESVFSKGTDDAVYGLFLKLKPYDGPLPGKQALQVSP